MQLQGKHVLNEPPARIWEMLMNADILARVVPGILELERIAENSFKVMLEIKLGPVSGSFSGNMQIEEVVEQKGFTLKVQQNSKIGNAKAEIKINLLPIDDNRTEVAFAGDARLSGLLASMGQRVISGVSSNLTKQFFSNLEKELETPKSSKGDFVPA